MRQAKRWAGIAMGALLMLGVLPAVSVCGGGSGMTVAAAKEKAAHAQGTIVFVPPDARPICYQQTAEVVEQLGYKVLSPSAELFGNTKWDGDPDGILSWLEENSKHADAVVLSTDTLLYGGLIPSRKHDVPQDVLDARMARIEKLAKSHPKLKLYAFASLMRTPMETAPGFDEEPKYYETYGPQIFRLTALYDKRETAKLTADERREIETLEKGISADALNDWLGRRAKNLAMTKRLMDMTAEGSLSCLVVGRDDNAPLCQTHRENRELLDYAKKKNLPQAKFRSLPGIDEFGLLLLAHAVNDLRDETPTVYVDYHHEATARKVPAFSDEPLRESIEASVALGGGKMAVSPKNADFVLMVHTAPDGKNREPYNSLPNGRIHLNRKEYAKNAESFAEKAEGYVNAGYPVGIADLMFGNGADNALMESLCRRGLLYRIKAYSGWNTPTNSSGFAVGTGMLVRHTDTAGKNRLLTRRYLDDWGYQANVRQKIADQLFNLEDRGASYYSLPGEYVPAVEERTTRLLNDFAASHLPPFDFLENFTVTLPWHRMFECDIHFKNP